MTSTIEVEGFQIIQSVLEWTSGDQLSRDWPWHLVDWGNPLTQFSFHHPCILIVTRWVLLFPERYNRFSFDSTGRVAGSDPS